MPRILVFSRSFEQGSTALDDLRNRAAALNIELVVVAKAGVFVFAPDGRIDRTDRIVGDVTTAALAYRARGDAAFFVDHGTAFRVAYDAARPAEMAA